MSKTLFQFEHLVGCEIVSVTAEYGGGYDDDYIGFDLEDCRQLQLVAEGGTLRVVEGNLEELLNRPVIAATSVKAESDLNYDRAFVETFFIAVEGPAKVHTVVIQYIDYQPISVTVEMK